jgi:hypothetical protein
MQLHRVIAAVLLLLAAGVAFASLAPKPTRETHIEGEWKLNASLSDDAQKTLDEQLRRQRERMMDRMRKMNRRNPMGLPPPDAARDLPPPSEDARARMRRRRQEQQDIRRRLLTISNWLKIKQEQDAIDFSSAVEQRRLDPGMRVQVSMPEGELADAVVGWQRDTLVIERETRDGPDIVEKLRWLKATDQLEYRLAVKGDSELAGIKLKRIYDRIVTAAPPMNPVTGPVR